MAANQGLQDLNSGLSSNFWWLRSAKHVKFAEECMMCTVTCFSKKNYSQIG